MKPVRLWHLLRNYVETDNALPVIHAIANHLPHIEQKILLLHPNREPVQTPILRHLLADIPVLLPHEFLQGPGWGRLVTALLAATNIRKKDYLRIVLRHFAFQEEAMSRCDILHLTANTLSAVFHDSGDLPGKIGPLFTRPALRRILSTETFDQFHEVAEFLDCGSELTVHADAFLSRGDWNKIHAAIPRDRALAIGAPRYSGYWIRHLDRLPVPRPALRGPGHGPVLLFLPSKGSNASFPGLDLSEDDRFVFGLLDRHPTLRLIVKPHPKTRGRYRHFHQFTPHGDRVTLFQSETDSALLATLCDVMVTSCTTFVPHLLWLQKPVILLDEWTARYGCSLMYHPFCHKREETADLLGRMENGEKILPKVNEAELAGIFQTGMIEGYEAMVVEKLRQAFS
ncbi:MAG: hypothetical protein HQM03_03815 [Magnetococcales bacterium]|nr:hypothetical protein [Magnetococcales bacterium]